MTTTNVQMNLEDLRGQLTTRLALIVLVSGQLFLLFYDIPPEPFPVHALLVWLGITGLGGSVLSLVRRGNTDWARRLLVAGGTAVLTLLLFIFPATWLPYLGVILVFAGALLVQWSEFAITLFLLTLIFVLDRPYDVTGLLIVLPLALFVSTLAIRTVTTALSWLWNTHQQAIQLLATTRSQQAELKQMVKSLTITNDLRLRAERELRFANKQIRAAQKLKEQFAANISHELRTPLSIILGFSEVMYLSPEVYGEMAVSPKLYRDISQIYRNSRHLLNMIDDILDLSHFEMSQFSLHKEPVLFAQLLEDTLRMVAPLFQTGKVQLVSHIPSDLPQLELDQTRIRQVLLNLLNNARRFTEQGEVTVSVVLQETAVSVHVSDTGPGIPSAQLPHIFEEFYQVDYSLSRSHGGAGLGLAICQRFVEAHGGRIWVDSTEGVGTTFSFQLPLEENNLFKPRLIESRAPLDLPRLVVVDDDPQVGQMVARHLPDVEVITVSVQEVETAVTQHTPHLIIWNSPPNQTPSIPSWHVPTVVCSLPSHSWMANALGVVASLNKPIDFERLAQEIKRLEVVKTVLVVDDNPAVCQLIERGLARIDSALSVHVAYDGATGLALLQQEQPDLLLLDLMMPNVDGTAVLHHLQQDPQLSQIPVILITATNILQDQLNQAGSGFAIYKQGGLNPRQLLSCLADVSTVFKTD